MCHFYRYNNVNLLRNFFYSNIILVTSCHSVSGVGQCIVCHTLSSDQLVTACPALDSVLSATFSCPVTGWSVSSAWGSNSHSQLASIWCLCPGSMPSKYRKKRQKWSDRYNADKDNEKRQSHSRYVNNQDTEQQIEWLQTQCCRLRIGHAAHSTVNSGCKTMPYTDNRI